jgi:hypothetical protein
VIGLLIWYGCGVVGYVLMRYNNALRDSIMEEREGCYKVKHLYEDVLFCSSGCLLLLVMVVSILDGLRNRVSPVLEKFFNEIGEKRLFCSKKEEESDLLNKES